MRIKWIDILKGIGIISVVLGHSGLSDMLHDVLYWFHMPLFFFVSGYLYNKNKFDYLKKIKSFMIPYFSFYILITLIRITAGSLTFQSVIDEHFWLYLKGGEYIKGYYGVFWFVTVLLATTIIYHLLQKYIKYSLIIHILMVIFYILAYYNAILYKELEVYWDLNVVLIAIVYYHIGYLYKQHQEIIHKKIYIVFLFSIIIVSGLLYKVLYEGYVYKLSLKYQVYNHFGWDVIVPIAILVLLIALCILLSKSEFLIKFIGAFGASSMTIMYLHNTIMKVLPSYISNFYVVVILAIILPLLFDFIIKKFKVTRILFFGTK